MTSPPENLLPGGPSEDGYTLIELMVVIAILGLMLALIGFNAKPVSAATHARASAEELSGVLRTARSLSLMSNRSVSVAIDIGSPGYRVDGNIRHDLPKDVRLSLLVSRENSAKSEGLIRFDPDGGSSGGRVTVEGDGKVWWVGIDWLSGRVTIAQAPRS